jgi:hypothetical protein
MKWLMVLLVAALSSGCATLTVEKTTTYIRPSGTVEKIEYEIVTQKLRFETGQAIYAARGPCKDVWVTSWDRRGSLFTDGDAGQIAASVEGGTLHAGPCFILRAAGVSSNSSNGAAAVAGGVGGAAIRGGF